MRIRGTLLLVLSLLLLCGDLLPRLLPVARRDALAQQPAAERDRELRQPGFLFLELVVTEMDSHIAFFKDVAGYQVVRNDGDFAILETEHGQLLLTSVNQPRQ